MADTVPYEDPSTDPPVKTEDSHEEIRKQIAEEKKQFIEKKKAEKEAQQKEIKEKLLKQVPHAKEVPLPPGGGEPEDLESVKRRAFVKQVCDDFFGNLCCTEKLNFWKQNY